jgi:hypothetical protein
LTYIDRLNVDWPEFVLSEIHNWTNFYRKWLEAGHLHVLRYEALLSDVRQPLLHILTFLGQPKRDELLDCAIREPNGQFKRPTKLYPIDPFAMKVNGSSLRTHVESHRIAVYELLERHLHT